MRWFVSGMLLVCVVLALRGQSERSRPAWEFATVEVFQDVWIGNVKHSTANVCYHGVNGCRWDTVRVTVGQWGQINDAQAAALARLGEQGWEAVAVTPLSLENRPSVLLKRARSE